MFQQRLLFDWVLSSQLAHRTAIFLDESQVEKMDRPPYSPDLAPGDFFPGMIAAMKERGFLWF